MRGGCLSECPGHLIHTWGQASSAGQRNNGLRSRAKLSEYIAKFVGCAAYGVAQTVLPSQTHSQEIVVVGIQGLPQMEKSL